MQGVIVLRELVSFSHFLPWHIQYDDVPYMKCILETVYFIKVWASVSLRLLSKPWTLFLNDKTVIPFPCLVQPQQKHVTTYILLYSLIVRFTFFVRQFQLMNYKLQIFYFTVDSHPFSISCVFTGNVC